ncbi:hypothetical protein NHG29_04020 [Aerococcaceae bacterium NML160702]|nr:hypothetical protein [Aerococcaceae bacterium NML160702]
MKTALKTLAYIATGLVVGVAIKRDGKKTHMEYLSDFPEGTKLVAHYAIRDKGQVVLLRLQKL